MERLALERKNLVENVKKLDEAMLALRSVASTSPAVAQRLPRCCSHSPASAKASVWTDHSNCLIPLRRPLICERWPGVQVLEPHRHCRPRLLPCPFPCPCGRAVAREWAFSGPNRCRAGNGARASAHTGRHAALLGPSAGMDPWQIRRAAPRDIQRRQPVREDRRACRKFHPVRREGNGLCFLPPDRRSVERDSAIRLRDGRFPQGTGEIRIRET